MGARVHVRALGAHGVRGGVHVRRGRGGLGRRAAVRLARRARARRRRRAARLLRRRQIPRNEHGDSIPASQGVLPPDTDGAPVREPRSRPNTTVDDKQNRHRRDRVQNGPRTRSQRRS